MISSFDQLNDLWNVSRETFDKLIAYQELLLKWQNTINLVSPSTLNNIWQRHILDSAQLASFFTEQNKTIADLGSGAGFPGMVLAILGIENIHLLESDARKIAFLQEVKRVTKADVTLHLGRIENHRERYDILTARALAPLSSLLKLGEGIIKENTICRFLKGKNYSIELEEARNSWDFSVEITPSKFDAEGVILTIQQVTARS